MAKRAVRKKSLLALRTPKISFGFQVEFPIVLRRACDLSWEYLADLVTRLGTVGVVDGRCPVHARRLASCRGSSITMESRTGSWERRRWFGTGSAKVDPAFGNGLTLVVVTTARRWRANRPQFSRLTSGARRSSSLQSKRNPCCEVEPPLR